MLVDAMDSFRFLCQNGPGQGTSYGPGYGMYGGYNMMSSYGGGLMMILLLVLVLVLFFSFTRRSGGGQTESALDVLKKRYAKGEITKEDFERMKQELKD